MRLDAYFKELEISREHTHISSSIKSRSPNYLCTDNARKEKYVCKLFAVLITLYVNSRLHGFHDLMVFMIIVFMNTQDFVSKEKQFLKARHRVA